MPKYSKVIFFVLIISLVARTSAMAWGFCDRSFTFLGRTMGDTCTMAIMEIGSGACEYWRVHYLQLGPKGLISKDAGGWALRATLPIWDTSKVVGDTLEWVQNFRPVEGEFVAHYPLKYRIRAPEYDSAFALKWADSLHTPFSGGVADKPFEEPKFNMPVELVWNYPNGLYTCYEIAEVIMVGKYIYIRIHQPLEGNGTNYHGVLVYLLK